MRRAFQLSTHSTWLQTKIIAKASRFARLVRHVPVVKSQCAPSHVGVGVKIHLGRFGLASGSNASGDIISKSRFGQTAEMEIRQQAVFDLGPIQDFMLLSARVGRVDNGEATTGLESAKIFEPDAVA